MICFCQNDSGVVMYKDDTYLDTDKFVIDRPATDVEVAAHPDEHAAFIATTMPAEPAPAESVPADSTPTQQVSDE